MSKRMKLTIAAVATLTVAAYCLATPVVGLLSPILAAGNQNADIDKSGTGPIINGDRFHAEIKVDGPSTLSIQDVALGFPGQNGWHSHPGLVAVMVISGSIEWFDHNCVKTIYKAGDGWMEGGQVHAFRNLGPGPVHLMASFITAQRSPLRTDETPPACATGLGL